MNLQQYNRKCNQLKQVSNYDEGQMLQAARSISIAREQLARAAITLRNLSVGQGIIPDTMSDAEFVNLHFANLLTQVAEDMPRQLEAYKLGCW